MKEYLTFSNEELERLHALKGMNITCLYGDPIEAALVSNDLTVIFHPLDLSAPVTSGREEEVIRLAVESRPEESFKGTSWNILGQDIGTLEHAWFGRTCVTFTDLHPVGSTQLLGVELPAGMSFSAVFIDPNDEQMMDALRSERRSIVYVDLAFHFTTSKSHSTVIYVDGVRYLCFLSLNGAPLDKLGNLQLEESIQWVQLF